MFIVASLVISYEMPPFFILSPLRALERGFFVIKMAIYRPSQFL